MTADERADVGSGGQAPDPAPDQPAAELGTVRLLDFPLPVFARSDEYHAELLREFALLALSPPSQRPGHDVPLRLTALIEALGREYTGIGAGPDSARDAALAEGRTSIDLVYQVPRRAKAACADLDALLDEAEEFCRAGEQLLTLAAPPEALGFRRWYLGEFVRQLDGAPPRPWVAG